MKRAIATGFATLLSMTAAAVDDVPELPSYPTELDAALAMSGTYNAEGLAKLRPEDPRRIAAYVILLLWETDDLESSPPAFMTEVLKDWRANGVEMAPVLIAMMEQHPGTLGQEIADRLKRGDKLGIETAEFLRYARNRYERLDFNARDKKGEIVAALILGSLGDESDIPRIDRIRLVWKNEDEYIEGLVDMAYTGLTARLRKAASNAVSSEEAKGEVLNSLQSSLKEGSLPDSSGGQKGGMQERVDAPQWRRVGLLGAGILLFSAVVIGILMWKKKSG